LGRETQLHAASENPAQPDEWRHCPETEPIMSDNPFSFGASGGYGGTTVSFAADAASPANPAANTPVKDVTTASFKADVLDASRAAVVLVDFWAPWCGPCKQLAPPLEKVVAESQGRAVLVKMNIDDHPAVAGQLGIQSIPAVIAFKNGQPVDGFMGAIPEKEIRKFVDRVAGPPVDPAEEILAMAAEAREAGDIGQAAQILASAINQGFAVPSIVAALAEAMLDLDDAAGALAFLADVPDDVKADKAFTALNARLRLAEEVAKLGNPAELAARIAADPRDLQARFDMSAIHNARGERDAAVDLLIEIMRKDRQWREDGARLRLLEYFEAWGFSDPATLSGRRKLSSVLFA
jgi:putative thioredoxin